MIDLRTALENDLWKNHTIGDTYTMDGKPVVWKIAYYPIFECGKTGEIYGEPRACMEKPVGDINHYKEAPLRYLAKR